MKELEDFSLKNASGHWCHTSDFNTEVPIEQEGWPWLCWSLSNIQAQSEQSLLILGQLCQSGYQDCVQFLTQSKLNLIVLVKLTFRHILEVSPSIFK